MMADGNSAEAIAYRRFDIGEREIKPDGLNKIDQCQLLASPLRAIKQPIRINNAINEGERPFPGKETKVMMHRFKY